MTTSPVMSISEELVAELERSVECVWPETDLAVVALRALLAERADLLRDAARYWFARHLGNDCFMLNTLQRVSGERLDAAIDAAMQSEAKP